MTRPWSVPLCLALYVGAALSGCVQPRARVDAAPAPPCPSPLEPHVRTALYTGAIPDTAWQRFEREVLVHHFPAGGTVLDNTGWWRRPNGTMYRNTGKTLMVLAPITEIEAHHDAVRAVIATFKQRFNQRSVGWEEDRVCAGF